MNVKKTKLDGILIIEPQVFSDSRGFFLESFSRKNLAPHGIDMEFVQDNHSRSAKGTLRGLHYQLNPGQSKLIRVTAGEVYDVVVDIRRKSPTFGQWDSFIISAENKLQLFVPIGFAHGFCVLSDYADFIYKCSDYYSPKDERGIIWNDPDLAVKWPVGNPILSKRDLESKPFKCQDRDLF